jgi:NAD(P)-dependent dehydrogenase (short-subunit alcohol dehydrogenase family)
MKTIIITGAGRGLGFFLTRNFLEMGHRVFALNRSKSAQADELAKKFPQSFHIIHCDVSKTADVKGAAAELADTYGIQAIDILLNNAGVDLDLGHLVDYSKTDFDAMKNTFDINTAGPMRVIQAFAKFLKKGSLCAAISSGAGSVGLVADTDREVETAYCVSKAALNMAFTIAGHTLHKSGVRTLLIDPGWMHTDMGGPSAPCDPEENAKKIAAILLAPPEGLPFVSYEGKAVPW